MTLIITALTKRTIYQSADYRLVNLGTRQITSDTSTKLILLHYADWEGFVAYTGIGSWGKHDTSEYVIQWLEGLEVSTVSDIAARIRDKGTEWLAEIAADYNWQRHTFILASFRAGIAQLDIISNFEDCFGRNDANANLSLTISTRRFAGRSMVVVSGCKAAVTRDERRRLKRLVCGIADDPARVRQILAEINAGAARAPAAQGMISPTCSVVSLRADGRGACNVDGEIDMHSMLFGMRSPDMREIAKQLGLKTPRLTGMTFASNKPWIPYAPCHPRTITPADNGGYIAREISLRNFATCWARDVNDVGVVLGGGELVGRPGNKVMWTASLDGEPNVCTFITEPGGVNHAGEVAGKARMDDGFEHAVRWSGENLIDLGCYRGKDGGAVAINSVGLAVGWVSIDSVNRGQSNFRPAAWSFDRPIVLEDFGCDWGQAVDVSDAGIVLVVGYVGMQCHAILWDPLAGTIAVIGGRTGIYPTAITTTGVVLGTANDNNGKSVAFLARPGQRWERLGTLPGFYVTAMNDACDIVGAAKRDGYEQLWLRRASGEILWLPYFKHHHCRPSAINNHGVIVGNASTDHGAHALIWTLDSII